MKNYLKEIVCDEKKYEWFLIAPMVTAFVGTYGYVLYRWYGDPRWWVIVVSFFGIMLSPVVVGFPIAIAIRLLRKHYNGCHDGKQR